MNRFSGKGSGYLKFLVVFVCFACISVLAATPVQSAPVKVGIIAGGSASSSNLAAQLNDDTYFDFSATVIGPSDADTVSKLGAYDVVILGDSGYNDNGYTAAMFAAIRSWMDNGGGVVTVGWFDYATGYWTGQMAIDADYITPIATITGGSYRDQNGGNFHVDNSSHPITNGIADFPIHGGYLEYGAALDSGAVKLGSPSSDASGYALAYQETHGRSVYLGDLYLASTSYSEEPYTRSGVQDRLLEQAVFWAANGSHAQVPTLSEWGMIILMLLLSLSSIVYMRRRCSVD